MLRFTLPVLLQLTLFPLAIAFAAATEVVVDNTDKGFTSVPSSAWTVCVNTADSYGTDYLQCTKNDPWTYAKWTPNIQTAGEYDIYISWPDGENRPDAISVIVKDRTGLNKGIKVDQTKNCGKWNLIGRYNLRMSYNSNYILIQCNDDGNTAADAVKCVLVSTSVVIAKTTEIVVPTEKSRYPDIPSVVKIVKDNSIGKYALTVNGNEFFVKGVCGVEDIEKMHEAGANSARLYSYVYLNGYDILDRAQDLGMKLLFGLHMRQENPGFTYAGSKKEVAEQYTRLISVVDKYKNHPAVLAWAVGNEVEANTKDVECYKAINDIARYIKKVDPNHPTVAVLAGSSPEKVQNVIKYAPEIDIVAVNAYKHLKNAHQNITGPAPKYGGWPGPYLITEFACNASYEVITTTWGAPIEQSSYDKAPVYSSRYAAFITSPSVSGRCIGSYAFKLARVVGCTHTWYNMLLDSETMKTPIYDEMYFSWTGKYPANMSPRIKIMYLDNKRAYENIVLSPETEYRAMVEITHDEGEQLRYRYELREELHTDLTKQPADIVDVSMRDDPGDVHAKNITTPSTPGYYRLYCYVYDGASGHVGTANVPFRVK